MRYYEQGKKIPPLREAKHSLKRLKSASISNPLTVMYVFSLGKVHCMFWFRQILDFFPQRKEAARRCGERNWIAWKLPVAWALKNLCFITLSYSLSHFFVRVSLKPAWKKHEETWGKWDLWAKTNNILTATETILHGLCQERGRQPSSSGSLSKFSVARNQLSQLCWYCTEHKKSRSGTGRCYHSENSVEVE